MTQRRRAIEAVWRIESGRLIAGLARMLRDVSLAEDLAQDALVAALEKWPESGVPDNPGAWLMTVAKHRAIDLMRRSRRVTRSTRRSAADGGLRAVDEVGDDDLLSLIFTVCHPCCPIDARVALTLRMLGGLSDAGDRARVPGERGDRRAADRAGQEGAGRACPFEIPGGDELRRADCAGVLEVVYLIFNEGYSATAGEDWVRPALCEDALRLARVLSVLAPRSGEVWGLLALLEIQASRLRARVARDGTPILLLDQDRSRWDRLLIRRGLAGAAPRRGARASAPTACRPRSPPATPAPRSPPTPTGSGSPRSTRPSRASPAPRSSSSTARSRSAWPSAPRPASTTSTRSSRALAGSTTCSSVRGDLLAKLGRATEARAEFERAASLTSNTAERDLLLARAAAL